MHAPFSSSSFSFWQSHIWKNILVESHQTSRIEIFSYEGKAILIEFRSVWLGMIGAFSLGIDASQYTEEFFAQALLFLGQSGAIFYQREAYFDRENTSLDKHPKISYKSFLEPYTRTIDLTKDESVILSEMHEKWRYNIRLSEKRGVKLQWVEPTAESIDIWMDILSETTSRDHFAHNSRSYYASFFENITKEKCWWLLFAYFEDRVIAAGIFVYFWESALYYYGASTSDREMRKHMAPYALQWEAIREGKRRWCTFYDFLGVASPYGNDDGHLVWVTDFKEKFGGKVISLWKKEHISLSHKDSLLVIVRFIRRLFFRS